MLYKDLQASVLDVDDKSRMVKVAFSQVGSLDSDNDIIDPGAFTKTIKERGPQGSKSIWHLTNHKADLQNVIGKPDELKMEGDLLTGKTKVIETNWGNDVLKMYYGGLITEHSIGFKITDSQPMNNEKGNYQLIKQVKLYEGSAVLWGANPNTPTLSVGKAENKEETITNVLKELDLLCNAFKSGTYTDETFGLLELRKSMLKDFLRSILSISTEAAPAAPRPESNSNDLQRLKLLIQI